MPTERISIITINYNNAKGLAETIQSVRGQTFREIEYVVIDGGSTDESNSVIAQNKDIVSYHCSEKDEGIYDAQNKGILRSTGDYLLFLNSGDLLANVEFLKAAVGFLNEHPDHSFVYCNTILKKMNGDYFEIIQPDKLDLFFFFNQTLNHQSCLIRRDLFDLNGLYEINYKVCADFDFILKAFTRQPSGFIHFNVFAAIYDNSGFSSDLANYAMIEHERKEIINKYFTKTQIRDCISRERRLNNWQVNLKKQLYANRASYRLIQFYVTIKKLIWNK